MLTTHFVAQKTWLGVLKVAANLLGTFNVLILFTLG